MSRFEYDAREQSGILEAALSYSRAAVALPAFAALTGACSVVGLGLGAAGRTRAADRLIHAWARATLKLFNVRVEAEGLERLPPPSRGCLYLFNHQSHTDIVAIHATLPRTLRFGAKIELFRIPLFGWGMRAVGVLPIARDRRDEVARVYREAGQKLDDGWSFILAPEGTRQSEPRIGPFKKGPFHFAVEAQALIVPIVLKGTIDVLPKGRVAINAGRWSRTVKLRVLSPIHTAGLGRDDIPRLMDDVRARMIAAYESM